MKPPSHLPLFALALALAASSLPAQIAESPSTTDKSTPISVRTTRATFSALRVGKAPLLRAAEALRDPLRPAIPPGHRRYIVMLDDAADQQAFLARHGLICERSFQHACNGFIACLTDVTMEKIRDDPNVVGVEENRIAGQLAAQNVPSGVKRMAVEQFPVAKINGLDERIAVDIAVFDTGVQPDHPDLNVVQTHSVFGGFTPEAHGTASAGVIGALDNDFGTVGIAPGARIWSVAFPRGFYVSDVYDGFEYIAAHADEIEVANCSFGNLSNGQSHLRSSYERIVMGCVNKGVVVVCGAGNFAADVAGPNGVLDDGQISDNFLPAGLPGSMAVSAMDPVTDLMASYSNFSASNHANRVVFSPGAAIDLAAPGNNVGTTLPGSAYSLGGYSGTSCAAPHATGLVALYIAAHGRAYDAAGVYRIRQAIVDAAQPQSEWQSGGTRDPDTNPEGLGRPSLNWSVAGPHFTRLTTGPAATEIEFTTLPSYRHTLQGSDTLGAAGVWQDLLTVDGSGGLATALDPGAHRRRFYRALSRPAIWPDLTAPPAMNIGTAGVSGNGRFYILERGVAGALPGEPLNKAVRSGVAGACVTVPFLPALNPAGAFTAEIWAKPVAIVSNGEYWNNYTIGATGSSGTGWGLYQSGNASAGGNYTGFTFMLRTGGTSNVQASVTLTLSTAQWYHLAGVFDGAVLHLFVNGTLVRTAALGAGQTYIPNASSEILWGRRLLTSGTWFPGDLDEAAIYPFALTAAQVLAHYHAGIHPAPPVPFQQVILNDNPAGYWRFNEP